MRGDFNEKVGSLLDAVSKKDKKAIKDWEEAAAKGEIVRIM